MTKNFDDLFSSWLEDGPTRASDRIVESLRIEVAQTPQRKPSIFRPRSDSAMTTFFKLGALATAGIALLLAALNLAPAGQPSTGGEPTAAPSSTPSELPFEGSTYRNETFVVPFSFTMPSTWNVVSDEFDWMAAIRPHGAPDEPAAGIDVAVVDHLWHDPCVRDQVPADPPIGPTAKDIADWRASFEPLHASDPIEVDLGGIKAWRVDENFVGSPGCETMLMFPSGAGYVTPIEQKHYYVFQIEDLRLVAVSISRDDGTPADAFEADAVLHTLTFE